MTRTCRHCAKRYSARIGRGLCRSCWKVPIIRRRYAVVAAFGGSEAADEKWRRARVAEREVRQP